VAEKPNILFIMVDDLGKEWMPCYGAEGIETPHIDALARGGMRFSNAYSMPKCTPSRTTLLTGKYPFRTGWVNHWDVPRWGVGYFDWRKNDSFARRLKEAGYATCAAGKWQINDFRLEPLAMEKHGFDAWCMWTGYEAGNEKSASRYWDPYIHTREGSRVYEGQFGPDVFTDFIIDFMKKHRDEPMCIYYPMVLVHSPVVCPPGETEAKTGLEKHKAMVRYVDLLVGRLVEAVDQLGIRDRTFIVFTTDNGTGGKMTGMLKGRSVKGGKGEMTENGICEPFIVNAPGRVPSNSWSDALIDFSDLFPTFLDWAGVPLPAEKTWDGSSFAPVAAGGRREKPRAWILAMGHGVASVDADGLRGKVSFCGRVLRDKRFKVWISEDRQITDLYDLKNDPAEQVNLVDSQNPDCLAALKKFNAILATFPEKDARPAYTPRKPNVWDRKEKKHR
jgi:arylsulfatase A-like enzyme